LTTGIDVPETSQPYSDQMQTNQFTISPDGNGWRRQQRLAVSISVDVEVDGGRHIGRIVELSPRGARVHLANIPGPGHWTAGDTPEKGGRSGWPCRLDERLDHRGGVLRAVGRS
jgi:hypothetical protein